MGPSTVHKSIHRTAHVTLYDETHGVFGELIDPQVVWTALKHYEENVGKLDDPSVAKAITALRSLRCDQDTTQIALEVDNATNFSVRVRWMDEKGHNNPSTHQWNVDHLSTWFQWTQPGHLFLVSVIMGGKEHLLGAYRTLMSLPSGWPHCILIQQDKLPGLAEASFFFETLLTDETKQDALQVAAAALDPLGQDKKHKTLEYLSTIVNNILLYPNDHKYKTLKLSNHRVQHQIAASWGAMYLLHLVGFREIQESGGERCLVLLSDLNVDLFERAKKLLELLSSRVGMVPELAPRAPWQAPASSAGSLAYHWNRQGTHFITPHERWERTERMSQMRRGGYHRPPDRGEAPSSRGLWGR